MGHKDHILAIGDIHGMLDSLLPLLDKVLPMAPDDARLVFLGDYIDRGPDSKEVVETLIQLKKQRPDTVFLMGNHEQMFLQAHGGKSLMFFLANGGDATLASYGLAPEEIADMPPDHLAFFNDLLLYFETENHVFVHAGLRPGVALAEQDPRDLLWIREEFMFSSKRFPKTVVFGHTPVVRPFVNPDRIGIDTGAVYGNLLTCLMLPEMRFVSV